MSFEIRSVEPEPGAPIRVRTLIKYTPPLIRKESEVVIPSGVEFIGKGAFQNCQTIKSVKVSSRLTGTIQEDAFRECRALERIELPFTVAYIGDNAFRGCTALTGMTTAGFGSDNSLPHKVRYIGSFAFANCKSLKELSMYDKVNFIGDGAFCGCSSLERFEIPYSVENIGMETFSGCSSLKRIKIPDSVKTIGENAFYGCKELKCFELAYEILGLMPEIEGNGTIETYDITVVFEHYRLDYLVPTPEPRTFKYESCGISKSDWKKIKQMIDEKDSDNEDFFDIDDEEYWGSSFQGKDKETLNEKIVRLFKEGYTPAQISKVVYVSPEVIVNVIRIRLGDDAIPEPMTAPETRFAKVSDLSESKKPLSSQEALLTLKNTIPAYNGNEPYIFISYAHKNAPEVLPVLQELKARGYRFWYDEGIEPGTAWRLNIADNVAKCAFFIALISDEYVASSFCKEELYFAEKKQRDLILVHIRKTDLPNDIDMAFSWKQQIMLHELPEPKAKMFVDSLEKLPGFDKFRK